MNFGDILFNIKADLLCVLVLVIILYKSVRSIDKRHTWNLFNGMVATGILFCTFFSFSNLIDKGLVHVSAGTSFLINFLYFLFLNLSCYLWFLYSENVQESVIVKNRRYLKISMIPMLLLIISGIASYKTHLVFYIDADHVYQRGSLFSLQYIMPYGYILFTSFKALYLSRRKENYAKKYEYQTLSLFVIAPIFFSGLQLLVPEALTVSMGITLATLLIYLNSQEILISVDPLTRLSNRFQLIHYLSQKMKNPTGEKLLYLFIMDVDYFKKINDQYGHVEGDMALVRVADALKQAARTWNGFAARFGGDEFIMVCELETAGEADVFCEVVKKTLLDVNEKAKVPYKLTLSIGYAEHIPSINTIPDFIEAADNLLYKMKKARDY